MRPAHFAFGFAAASLELLLPVLEEGLDEAAPPADELSLPLLEEGLDGVALLEDEVSLGVLLGLPLLEGELESAPEEDDPVPLAPDAPEELSVDELPLLLAPALAPPLAPPPCAQAAVANATMAAVTAALMSLRFIFSSSRVGDGDGLRGRGRKNNALFGAVRERSA